MPVWHASIAAHGFAGPIPWALLGEPSREIMRRTVLGLLAGAGQGDIRRDRSDTVLHARRRLADRELAQLTPEWCAAGAVDVAGGGVPW